MGGCCSLPGLNIFLASDRQSAQEYRAVSTIEEMPTEPHQYFKVKHSLATVSPPSVVLGSGRLARCRQYSVV